MNLTNFQKLYLHHGNHLVIVVLPIYNYKPFDCILSLSLFLYDADKIYIIQFFIFFLRYRFQNFFLPAKDEYKINNLHYHYIR